ncbi:OmpA family protein [Roseobacteraceae bacterium NS-SX3]
MIRYAALLGAVLAAGCAREAGHRLSDGGFGTAAGNNAAVMAGERGYAVQLATRFAAEVPSTITFAFDSASLDGTARAVLDQQAHWIRQFPEVRFRVYGHTDAVGPASYNKALGLRRAQAAVNYLVSRGISRSRLEAIASFGEAQPLIPTQARERRNRRTETQVSGFLKGHPMVLDGKYAQVVYREYVESAVPPSSLSNNYSLSGE